MFRHLQYSEISTFFRIQFYRWVMIQLFVLWIYTPEKSSAFEITAVSLGISLISNAYGNALALFPVGFGQVYLIDLRYLKNIYFFVVEKLLAFMLSLTDTIFRCGGFVYICNMKHELFCNIFKRPWGICFPWGWRRLSIICAYGFGGIGFMAFILDKIMPYEGILLILQKI